VVLAQNTCYAGVIAKIFLVWLLASCVTPSGKSGHEVGYLDLTAAVVGQRTHEPTTGSGSGMGSGFGDSIQKRSEILQPLRISVVSLGSAKYKLADDVVYEIKIENIGHERLEIPWDPNLAHVEPGATATEYSYRIASIALWLSDADKPFETLEPNLLYGTTEISSSFVKIAPGEWVRIRAKAPLSPPQSPLPDGTQPTERTILVRAVWTISNAHVSRRADGYHEDVTTEGSANMSVNTKSFEIVSPAQSN
jgi:hypothetical protein